MRFRCHRKRSDRFVSTLRFLMRFRLSILKRSKVIEFARCGVSWTLCACYEHIRLRLRYFQSSLFLSTVHTYMICMRFQIDSFSMKTLSVLAWKEGLNRHRNVCVLGEQGWRSGESTRLPPMWPGFKSRRRRHMWVEIVVGSLPCSERFFIGYSAFPLSLKTNTSKFRFDLEPTDTFQRVLMNS